MAKLGVAEVMSLFAGMGGGDGGESAGDRLNDADTATAADAGPVVVAEELFRYSAACLRPIQHCEANDTGAAESFWSS